MAGRSKNENGVTVITATHRPDYMERLLANYRRQNYPNKELIIVLNNNQFDLQRWRHSIGPYEDVSLIEMAGRRSLGYCYNYAVHRARFEIVAKFDDDDIYFPEYLRESVNALVSTNADIVGKSCRYIYFADLSTLALYCPNPENEFVSYVAGATMLIKRQVFQKLGFADITQGEDSKFQEECLQMGFAIFSGDRHHYLTIRHSSRQNHTFPMSDLEYLQYCRIIPNPPLYLAECISRL